jgi:hypothetical protein
VAPTLFSISSGIQSHAETGSHWSDTTETDIGFGYCVRNYYAANPESLAFAISHNAGRVSGVQIGEF